MEEEAKRVAFFVARPYITLVRREDAAAERAAQQQAIEEALGPRQDAVMDGEEEEEEEDVYADMPPLEEVGGASGGAPHINRQ